MYLLSDRGTINTTTAVVTFLLGISIALCVAVFHYYYFPQQYLSAKSAELATVLRQDNDFTKVAKELLDTRNDVAYLKLLDQNGVLEQSFGSETEGGTSQFIINAPQNKTILLGLRNPSTGELDSYAIAWSLLIGSFISFGLIFILFMQSPKQAKALKKMESAMERVSDGDLTARLDVDSSSDEDMGIMSAYQSFNRMVNTLNKKFGSGFSTDSTEAGSGEGDQDDQSEGSRFYSSPFLSSESEIEKKAEEDKSEYGEEENKTDSGEGHKVVDIAQREERPDEEKQEESKIPGEFKPTIILPDDSIKVKERNVTAFVAKIDNFAKLTEQLDPSDLSSFLTSYRKAASTIIKDYGGVIESLLQDEIVALFNAPEEQNDPELRSVCAAVEVLQILAKMNRDRKESTKPVINGKIAIHSGTVQYRQGSTGIPSSVKDIVSDAREIGDNSGVWKVSVTDELYSSVKNNVEVKRSSVNGRTVYHVVGVEEGVIQL